MDLIIALSPILWLVIALSVLKIAAHKACTIALIIALVAGICYNNMTVEHAAQGTLEGVALACWPILLVIIAAIFTYNLSLETKAMDTIKKMLASVSSDQRVLILLIGWGFGAFLEGMAGFGTAVAIPAGMLAGIGVNPILAASVCLIANTVPTAFGSIGIPVMTLASVTNMDAVQLAGYTAVQLAPLALCCPALMVMVAGKGIKGLKGMLIMCVVAGVALVVPEVFVAIFMGPELAVIVGSVCTMAAIIACAKLFPVHDPKYKIEGASSGGSVSLGVGFKACLSFSLIFVFLLLTSKLVPAINAPLSKIYSTVQIFDASTGAPPYKFVWINTPGVLIFLAAFIGGTVQGASPSKLLSVLGKTVFNLRFTILTIITVIATAKVMGYAGMTNTIAVAAVGATGTAYPLVAAFIGSIGTFITGSATSSCVLFGKLQTDAAIAIGAGEHVQAWVTAANATGACAGKIVSPQSIAIAVASIGVNGAEGRLLSFAVKFYIPFVIVMGLVVYFGQTIVP